MNGYTSSSAPSSFWFMPNTCSRMNPGKGFSLPCSSGGTRLSNSRRDNRSLRSPRRRTAAGARGVQASMATRRRAPTPRAGDGPPRSSRVSGRRPCTSPPRSWSPGTRPACPGRGARRSIAAGGERFSSLYLSASVLDPRPRTGPRPLRTRSGLSRARGGGRNTLPARPFQFHNPRPRLWRRRRRRRIPAGASPAARGAAALRLRRFRLAEPVERAAPPLRLVLASARSS